jgi:hypothetical protein
MNPLLKEKQLPKAKASASFEKDNKAQTNKIPTLRQLLDF